MNFVTKLSKIDIGIIIDLYFFVCKSVFEIFENIKVYILVQIYIFLINLAGLPA